MLPLSIIHRFVGAICAFYILVILAGVYSFLARLGPGAKLHSKHVARNSNHAVSTSAGSHGSSPVSSFSTSRGRLVAWLCFCPKAGDKRLRKPHALIATTTVIAPPGKMASPSLESRQALKQNSSSVSAQVLGQRVTSTYTPSVSRVVGLNSDRLVALGVKQACQASSPDTKSGDPKSDDSWVGWSMSCPHGIVPRLRRGTLPTAPSLPAPTPTHVQANQQPTSTPIPTRLDSPTPTHPFSRAGVGFFFFFFGGGVFLRLFPVNLRLRRMRGNSRVLVLRPLHCLRARGIVIQSPPLLLSLQREI